MNDRRCTHPDDVGCEDCSLTPMPNEATDHSRVWAERGWTQTDTANGMRYLALALEQSGHSEFCPTSMVAPTCACDCWKSDAAPLIEKWKAHDGHGRTSFGEKAERPKQRCLTEAV